MQGLPLEFVENGGQWPPETKLAARGRAGAVAFESGAMVFQAASSAIGSSATLAFRFEDANDSVAVQGKHPLPGTHNYLYGPDPERWTTGVATYASVEYSSLYEGIDLHVYEGGQLVEYDVVCDSGSRLPSFSVLCEEADELSLDEDGRLVARLGDCDLVQEPPVAWYLESDGQKRSVESRFELRGDKRFGLAVSEVLDLPLVVDPKVAFRVLTWSTHLGGNSINYDIAWDVAVSQYGQFMGQVFIVGETWSNNFPATSGAFQTSKGGTFDDPDVFVTRLNAQASAYVFSTFIGTSCHEAGYAVDLADDGSGNDIVPVFTGYFTGLAPGAGSICAYPTTTTAFDQNANKGEQKDAFVTVLDPSGSSLIYSSYLGGDLDDEGRAIAVIPNPTTEGIEFVVGGWTTGGGTITYPVQGGAGGGTPFQTSFQGGSMDGFLAHVTTVLTTIPPGGLVTTLLYSTYLGGTTSQGTTPGNDQVLDLKVNADPELTDVEVVAVGETSANDFPTRPGALQENQVGSPGNLDGYVSRLRMAGGGVNDLQQSTYLGGSAGDRCRGVVLTTDSEGQQEVTICGQTFSSDFPVGPASSVLDVTYNLNGDGFVTRLNETLSIQIWSTYLGGGEEDQALDIAIVPGAPATLMNICGQTKSADFPVAPTGLFPNQAFDITYNGNDMSWDGFVTRISEGGALRCSTFLGDNTGGNGDDIAWGISPDGPDQVVVVGQTSSAFFPTTQGSVQTTYGGGASDGFVTKLRVGNVGPLGQ